MSKAKAGNKKGLVPRLRFPEFRDSVDWTTAKLGSLTTINTEKVGNNSCIAMSITSGVGLVSQEEKFGRVIAGDSYKNYLLLKPNDFAYNKSSTKEFPEGFLTLYSGSELAAVPNSIFTCFRVKGKSPDPRFLNYLFLGNLHGRWLRKFIQVGARAHGSLSINDNDLMALPVPLPTGESKVAEQQKIAECLSSLDTLIVAQTSKIDALYSHKRALMQRLLTREDETVPYLRFPNFRDASDWSRCKLDNLTRRGSGHTPNKKHSIYYNGGVKWVSLADSEKLDNGYIYHTKHEISEEGLKNSSAVLHPPETVILSRDAGVGKSAILHSAMAVSQHFIAWRCNKKILSNWFLYYFLQKMKPVFESIAVGNTIKTIGLPYFKDMVISVPSVKEQQKIADCLSSLDALIAENLKKLSFLKAHKKGLMQKLFPVTEILG